MISPILRLLGRCLAICSLFCVLLDVGMAAELEFETQRVVVFKDGYGMFIKRAQGVTDEEGRLLCDQVPDEAILGSLWVDSPDAQLKRTRSRWVETEEEKTESRACRSVGELLKANLGRSVKLSLVNDVKLDGEILKLIGEEQEIGLPVISPAMFSSSSINLSRVETRQQATHVMLRNAESDVLVPISDIKLIRGADLVTMLDIATTSKSKAKQFIFEFDQPNQNVDVLLVYFRPGIRWIPTYRVDIDETSQTQVARVKLQAEFLNEAEPLHDVPIDIVVGVPNFRFRDTPSPLTLEAGLRNTLQLAAPQLMNQFQNNASSNALFTQRRGEFRGQPGEVGPESEGSLQLPSELTTVGTQDLFVYHLEKMTLELKERAAVHLFEAEVPFRHVYTWNVNVRRNESETAPSQSQAASPLVLSENQVWHQIELTNNTELPWTTGAAMLLDGQQPLAQELLTYTSIGGSVRIPITVAVDLRGTFDERETKREMNHVEWQGYKYAKISKQATLGLTNRKREPIDFEITCHVGGRATAAAAEGDIEVQPFQASDWDNYRGSPSVNNHSVIRWSRTLKPGETFESTVDYHFFARH